MARIKGNTLTALANGETTEYIQLLSGPQTLFLTVPVGTVILQVSPVAKIKWSTLKDPNEATPTDLEFAAGEHNIHLSGGNMFIRMDVDGFSGETPVELIASAN